MPASARNPQQLRSAVSRVRSGRQPDVELPKATADLIDEAVTRAVSDVMASFQKAPAFHDANRRDSKQYLDDKARESIGDDRADAREETERRAAENMATPGRSSSSLMQVRAAAEGERKPGALVAEYIGWLTRSRGSKRDAYADARANGGTDVVTRALGESTFASGGAFVPTDIATDFVGLLYNACVYLQAGPQRLTVAHGNMVLPKVLGGATANWLGESQNIVPSQGSFGAVRVDLRQLGILTAASNIFLRDSGPNAIEMIRADLQMQAAIAIDQVALRSLGTEWTPRGLRGWVKPENQFAATGATVDNITDDLTKSFRLLEEAKLPMGRLAIFMSPRTRWGLMAKRDGNGNPVWATEMGGGRLYGSPFFVTHNIPTNVGTGGNKSEIYMVDMSQQIFAEDPAGVRIDVSDGAAYYDPAAGGVVSGFSRDETAVRLIQRCDIVSRQNGAEIVQIYDVPV